MNYYRQLAYQLRLRGLDEQVILDELLRVRTAADPDTVFGTPQARAKTFGAESSRRPAGRLILAGGGFLLLGAVVQLAGLLVWHVDLRIGPLPAFGAALIPFAALTAVAFAREWRLPRGFVPARPDAR